MITTTTLFQMIQTELIKRGHDEFFNDNQLTFFNKEYAFIQKVMNYDNDIQDVVNEMFFIGTHLNNPESDKLFKRTFINKFLNRQIKFQTVEGFSSQVIYTLLSNFDYINKLYDELDDYLNGKQTNETNENTTEIDDNRQATSTLPQDKVNINVDNTLLDYADENTINRHKNEKTGGSDSESFDYNIDDLLKTNRLLDDVFIEFDKNCFLQVW